VWFPPRTMLLGHGALRGAAVGRPREVVRIGRLGHGPRSSPSDRARMREESEAIRKVIGWSYQEQIPNHQNMCRSSGNSYSNPNTNATRTPHGADEPVGAPCVRRHESRAATPGCALRAAGDEPQNGPPGRVRMREE